MNLVSETKGDNLNGPVRNCTVCGDGRLSSLLQFEAAPVHQNLLYPSVEAALACSVGRIELVACEACGFVFNRQFENDLLDYSKDYENSQDKSVSFSEHMSKVADGLVQRHHLRGKKILEIGCGKGGFLNLIVQIANGFGKGFDPSYVGDFDDVSALTFVKEFFPGNEGWWNPEQIVCRHVLEHINRPYEFVKMIRDSIPPRQAPHLYFEVPSFDWITDNLAFWDIFYEHCNYFTQSSINLLLQSCRFEVDKIATTFSGQYLSVDAVVRTAESAIPRGIAPTIDYEKFARSFSKRLEDLQSLIRKQHDQNKTVVVWGAAAKGSTFLNQLGLTTEIVSNVIDINPRKQGNYIAGTGQLICAPEFLRTSKCDVIYVMNPNYESEIRQQLTEMDLFPEIVVI